MGEKSGIRMNLWVLMAVVVGLLSMSFGGMLIFQLRNARLEAAQLELLVEAQLTAAQEEAVRVLSMNLLDEIRPEEFAPAASASAGKRGYTHPFVHVRQALQRVLEKQGGKRLAETIRNNKAQAGTTAVANNHKNKERVSRSSNSEKGGHIGSLEPKNVFRLVADLLESDFTPLASSFSDLSFQMGKALYASPPVMDYWGDDDSSVYHLVGNVFMAMSQVGRVIQTQVRPLTSNINITDHSSLLSALLTSLPLDLLTSFDDPRLWGTSANLCMEFFDRAYATDFTIPYTNSVGEQVIANANPYKFPLMFARNFCELVFHASDVVPPPAGPRLITKTQRDFNTNTQATTGTKSSSSSTQRPTSIKIQ
jgi:hypothetical protein